MSGYDGNWWQEQKHEYELMIFERDQQIEALLIQLRDAEALRDEALEANRGWSLRGTELEAANDEWRRQYDELMLCSMDARGIAEAKFAELAEETERAETAARIACEVAADGARQALALRARLAALEVGDSHDD